MLIDRESKKKMVYESSYLTTLNQFFAWQGCHSWVAQVWHQGQIHVTWVVISYNLEPIFACRVVIVGLLKFNIKARQDISELLTANRLSIYFVALNIDWGWNFFTFQFFAQCWSRNFWPAPQAPSATQLHLMASWAVLCRRACGIFCRFLD